MKHKMFIAITFLVFASTDIHAIPIDSSGTFPSITPNCGTLVDCNYQPNNGNPILTFGGISPNQSSVGFTGMTNIPVGSDQVWGKLAFQNGVTGTNVVTDFTLTIHFSDYSPPNNTLHPDVVYGFKVDNTPNITGDPLKDGDNLIWTTIKFGINAEESALKYLEKCQLCTIKSDIFKVAENAATDVEIRGLLGSAIPLGFGAISNPEVGILVSSVPEPGTFLLIALSILAMPIWTRWRLR